MDQFVFVIKLLQTMTYFRCLQPAEKLPLSANIRSEVSDMATNGSQWYHLYANGTIGKTPNVTTV